MNDTELYPQEGILHHSEGVDLVPANIELSGLEVSLVNVMSREKILKQFFGLVKPMCPYSFVTYEDSPSRASRPATNFWNSFIVLAARWE